MLLVSKKGWLCVGFMPLLRQTYLFQSICISKQNIRILYTYFVCLEDVFILWWPFKNHRDLENYLLLSMECWNTSDYSNWLFVLEYAMKIYVPSIALHFELAPVENADCILEQVEAIVLICNVESIRRII